MSVEIMQLQPILSYLKTKKLSKKNANFIAKNLTANDILEEIENWTAEFIENYNFWNHIFRVFHSLVSEKDYMIYSNKWQPTILWWPCDFEEVRVLSNWQRIFIPNNGWWEIYNTDLKSQFTFDCSNPREFKANYNNHFQYKIPQTWIVLDHKIWSKVFTFIWSDQKHEIFRTDCRLWQEVKWNIVINWVVHYITIKKNTVRITSQTKHILELNRKIRNRFWTLEFFFNKISNIDISENESIIMVEYKPEERRNLERMYKYYLANKSIVKPISEKMYYELCNQNFKQHWTAETLKEFWTT